MHLRSFHIFIYLSCYSPSPLCAYLSKSILVAFRFWQLWISFCKTFMCSLFIFFFLVCMCVWVFRLRQIKAMRCKEILTTWNLGLFCVSCILYWSWYQAPKIIVTLIEAFLATCAFFFFLGWCWLGCSLHWPGGWDETEVFLFWSLFSFTFTWASFQPADPGKAFYYWDECHSSVLM